ncbi:hypothetical protein MARPO_0069s0023 [Marchantia polymorpha]|uniref:Uncharacterized protein n=1 Tax=Marchantia polymorpha TaxID=3197 RepID=A0A2R6WPB0_MARPO|nr:hypothetical protein MARPO_0069s0023 [Marchantia polymorpha]PTQ35675.1 hypothetical protein MARPO_0069s0023 [Marchantia polymorpha]|eukprot:PTQ35674.1 hypothetical protein MARPO_0069s0023 [Marchantia polymorpha]
MAQSSRGYNGSEKVGQSGPCNLANENESNLQHNQWTLDKMYCCYKCNPNLKAHESSEFKVSE